MNWLVVSDKLGFTAIKATTAKITFQGETGMFGRFIKPFFALLIILTPLSALAEDAAGTIIYVTGQVTASGPGQAPRTLERRSSFYQSDTINCGDNASAQCRFTDGTLVGLRANSQFHVNKYVFTPAAQQSKTAELATSLTKGGLRMITGEIAKVQPQNVTLSTNVATIGVRGTDFEFAYANMNPAARKAEGGYAGVYKGSIFVRNRAGMVNLFSNLAQRYAFIRNANTRPQITSVRPDVFNTPIPGMPAIPAQPTVTPPAAAPTTPAAPTPTQPTIAPPTVGQATPPAEQPTAPSVGTGSATLPPSTPAPTTTEPVTRVNLPQPPPAPTPTVGTGSISFNPFPPSTGDQYLPTSDQSGQEDIGWYVGAGVSFGDFQYSFNTNIDFTVLPLAQSSLAQLQGLSSNFSNAKGTDGNKTQAMATVIVGYQAIIRRAMVGFEVEGSSTSLEFKTNNNPTDVSAGAFSNGTLRFKQGNTYGASALGGFVVARNTVAYARAGLVTTDFELNTQDVAIVNSLPDTPVASAINVKTTRIGTSFGAGVQFGITRHLKFRVEGSHVRFNNLNKQIVQGTADEDEEFFLGETVKFHTPLKYNTAKAVLLYTFPNFVR